MAEWQQTQGQAPRELWHHDLHAEIGNEQLVFILISFEPIYRRGAAVTEIRNAFSRLKVISYSLWELIGEHDMLIQAWLPISVTTYKLTEQIRTVSSLQFQTISVSVDRVIHHWLWTEPLDFELIARVVQPEDYINLNSAEKKVPARRLALYRENNLIRRPPDSKNMIKFFLRVTNPPRGMTVDVRERFVDLAMMLANHEKIYESVIYQVSGEGGCYLISGRIKAVEYESVATVLRESLGSNAMLDSLGARTITHLSAFHVPLNRREQLLPDTEVIKSITTPTEETVAGWLTQPESDNLELKSSAFTDLVHRIESAVGGKPTRSPRSRDEQVKEIAKAVVGMLNADGGDVVIGVAEVDRLQKRVAGLTHDVLKRSFPGAVQIRQRSVIGIDHEVPKGGKGEDYRKSLIQKLRNMIEEPPGNRIKLFDVEYQGLTVCVIRVERSNVYHWVVTKQNGHPVYEFYGREGEETRPLTPPQAEAFKRLHPRASGPTS